MDKVRVALELLKKFHFWLLCLLVVGVGLFGWMKARGKLADEYAKQKSAIVSKFQSLDQVQAEQFPPNDTWKTAMDSLTEVERKKVADTWKEVYDAQQQVLEWPQVLGDSFKNEVNRWLAAVRTQPDAEMSFDSRTNYRNQVANVEFPKLLEIVDAEPEGDDEKNPAPKPAADQPVRQYRVRWDGDSQAAVRKSLQMDANAVPKSFAVFLKLEDLWVYRALLKIIRATNEGSGYVSRVKVINKLLIGDQAGQEFKKGTAPGHIELPQAAAPADAGAGTPAPAPATEEDLANKPLDDNRYVDDNGEPQAGGATPLSGAAHTAQFKQMPVYLLVVMDQREIPRLLTECANSPLPVEVKQLRINPGKETGAKKQEPTGPANDAPGPTAPDAHDVTVEIHGVIYIYNPPDPAKLGGPAPTAA